MKKDIDFDVINFISLYICICVLQGKREENVKVIVHLFEPPKLLGETLSSFRFWEEFACCAPL